MENSPPHSKTAPLKRLNLRNWTKNPSNFGRKISDFGRKFTLNFGEDLFFFFFGDHLILGGKKLSVSELSEIFRLNFRTNRLKLLLDQWKFQSRSFAHFSLFQNSPPLFQILATRLAVHVRARVQRRWNPCEQPGSAIRRQQCWKNDQHQLVSSDFLISKSQSYSTFVSLEKSNLRSWRWNGKLKKGSWDRKKSYTY